MTRASVRLLGVAVILAPALALSALIFHERLNSAQFLSAAILLIGAFLAMQTKPAAVTETAENI